MILKLANKNYCNLEPVEAVKVLQSRLFMIGKKIFIASSKIKKSSNKF